MASLSQVYKRTARHNHELKVIYVQFIFVFCNVSLNFFLCSFSAGMLSDCSSHQAFSSSGFFRNCSTSPQNFSLIIQLTFLYFENLITFFSLNFSLLRLSHIIVRTRNFYERKEKGKKIYCVKKRKRGKLIHERRSVAFPSFLFFLFPLFSLSLSSFSEKSHL